MMNKNKQTELRQRFGFRKLASGMLVSGIIGAFFLVGSQSVQADTTSTDSAAMTAAVVETTNQEQNKVSSTNEVTNTNTEKETTSDQETTTNKSTEAATKAGVADSTATKQDTTATAATSKKLTDNTAKNTEKVAADTEIKQDAAVQTSVKTEANDNAKTIENNEATQNVKKEQIADAKAMDADKKVEVAATKDNQSQINFDDWGYSTNDDGVTINGYKGTDVADVIVPNTYDFLNAGIITGDQKAYIDRMTLRSIARTSGVKSITISHNGDGQLYVTDPKGLGLAAAFQTTYMTPNVETIDVSNLNTTGVVNFSNIFQGETNLKEIIGLDKWDLSSATNLGGLFQDCNNLSPDTFKQISKWNVSNVTNLAYTFAGTLINDLNLIKDWDVSNVTNLNATFYYLPELTTLDGLQNWNISKVTNLQATFEADPKLNDISAIKNWNTSNVTNFYSTFTYDSNLTDVSPLANWDTSKGQTFLYMFLQCGGLQNVDALNSWDVSNATNMVGMFQGTGLKGLVNLSNWSLHTGTNTDSMFAGGSYRKLGTNERVTINTPLMVIVKDQASADMINNGKNTFFDRYLTKFVVGEGETLNGDASHPAMAFTSTDAAKPDFEKWLKDTTASKDGYTFKGWQGVKGTEYGNSGLFGEYEPIFESNKPAKPEVPVTPENPDTPDVPTPVQPTTPDNNNNNQNNGGTDTFTPLPENPNNNSNTSENNVNKPDHSNGGANDNTSTVKPLATKIDSNSGKVENESTHANSVNAVTNTTVKAASFDNNNTSAKRLPQTGSENTSIWTILGLGLTSILGFLGLADRKKRN